MPLWAAVRDVLQAALEDDEVAQLQFDGPIGRRMAEP